MAPWISGTLDFSHGFLKNSGYEHGTEIRRLHNEKQAIQTEEASCQELKTRINELVTFLDGLPCELNEYDE